MSELRRYLDAERGRGSDLARELDVTPGAIWQWADSQVPAERIFKVSEITKISIEALRPDMFPKSGDAA
jgi:DNA-binding transcriptional regulator YdaS (Cro superfamily)